MDLLANLVSDSPFTLALAGRCHPVPLVPAFSAYSNSSAAKRRHRRQWRFKLPGEGLEVEGTFIEKPVETIAKKSRKKHKHKKRGERKDQQVVNQEEHEKEVENLEEADEHQVENNSEGIKEVKGEEEKESEGEEAGWQIVQAIKKEPRKHQQGNNKRVLLNGKPGVIVNGVSISLPYNGPEKVSVWVPPGWRNAQQGLEPDRPTDELRERWRKQQKVLATTLKLVDDFDWSLDGAGSKRRLRLVGGVDISFAKNSKIDACASIVVCAFPSMEVVYETYSMCKLTAPYIAGLLAFREVPFVKEIIDKMRVSVPDMVPDLLLVDGNGLLHMRLCGFACHLGAILDIPTVGVGKTLLYADGITDDVVNVAMKDAARNPDHDGGIWALLSGRSVQQLAFAYKHPKKTQSKILYISAGHKISLDTARKVVNACMQIKPGHYLPAPVQHADGLSRVFLKDNYSRFPQ